MVKHFLILLLLSSLILPSSFSQESAFTTFILVRHAEKIDDGSSDPGLTEEGHLWAKNVAQMLNHIDFEAIYSTNYNRTRQTAMPLAFQQALEILPYKPLDNTVIDDMISRHQGGNVFIVGHSNTVPSLVNYLVDGSDYPDLEHDEYDKIFIVTITKTGKGKVQVLSF
jgi:broad specificity phosphatase PhoE